MRKLHAFESVTLDGYFAGPGGDISWAHAVKPDKEWTDFVSGNAQGGGELLMGRVTYEMMASHWPTPQAKAAMPEVAKGMNEMTKHVASRTLKNPAWENTHVLSGDLFSAVRALKQAPGKGLTILGSGNIVAQLAGEGLIDQFQLVVIPVAIGAGRTLFEGVNAKLKLANSQAFKNGNVVLTYTAA